MSDISSLKQSFKGDIVTPADPNYKDAIARWAVNAERPARVVAFVKDEPDVCLALSYARNNNLPVAIRCGGHSPSGSSSAKDGLVVDLSRYFNYAVADPDTRTVRVGGGALWDTVEKESIKHNLATVAGSVSHVRNFLLGPPAFCLTQHPHPGHRLGFQGTLPLRLVTNLSDGMSRLLLGGGYGFLTGQHGLAVDNLLQACSLLQLFSIPFDRIIQATLITANGTTLTLSDTENAELFWGIRGGGSNFGICTEFVLRLHPQRRTIFSGLVVYPAEVLSELITVLNRWWKNAKKNEGMHMLLRKIPSSEKVGDNIFGIPPWG